LADRLVEAVLVYGPGQGPFAGRLEDLAAASPDEQTVLARREVVDHCLYGVDKNPVAAEMAKLSLWLTTMARERPFTFLDHAIQVGDSLLGITDLEQLRWLHLDPAARKGAAKFETLSLDLQLKETTELARRLQALSVVTVRDATEKQRLHDELRAKLVDLSIVADAIVGAALSTAVVRGGSIEQRLDSQTERIRTALDDDRPSIERSAALDVLHGISTSWLRTDLPDDAPMPWDRQCLHWPLAFPEVFLEEGRSGFDAVVANPPFLGGKRISGALGGAYREHLVRSIAGGVTGNADLVSYFILRLCELGATIGSLATNTVSQGDTREVGLDRILRSSWVMHRAVKSEQWPNEATLEIAKVWLRAGEWSGDRILDGRAVPGITAELEAVRRVAGAGYRLQANANQSFIGVYVNGIGFVLEPEVASRLIASDPRNAEVVTPYLNGADLNEDPKQQPKRWVIDFGNRSLEEASAYIDCLAIVERLVRPHRSGLKNKPRVKAHWWQFEHQAPAMRAATSGMRRVLALARISKTVAPQFIRVNQIANEKVVVFAYDDDGHAGVLYSAFHWWWAWARSATLRTDLSYAPTDVFETFPQPEEQSGPAWERVEEASRRLNEFRADLMIKTQLGLTKTYNRVHDLGVNDPDILRLRELHVELDYGVRDAYLWSDLRLDHHHWVTPQGMKFSVSPQAKDELLDRLLELNHERYAAEVAAGLHRNRGKLATAKRSPKAGLGQETLL
jgi:hypothetical protein